MEWQTMETAPRDGTEFLAVDENGLRFITAYLPEYTGGSGFGIVQSDTGYHVDAEPEAWMPLPYPPKWLSKFKGGELVVNILPVVQPEGLSIKFQHSKMRGERQPGGAPMLWIELFIKSDHTLPLETFYKIFTEGMPRHWHLSYGHQETDGEFYIISYEAELTDNGELRIKLQLIGSPGAKAMRLAAT